MPSFVSARSFLLLLGCTTALADSAFAQSVTPSATSSQTTAAPADAQTDDEASAARSSFGHADDQHGTTTTETSRAGEDAVTVNAHLERARAALQPSTGATVYNFSRQAIETNPGVIMHR